MAEESWPRPKNYRPFAEDTAAQMEEKSKPQMQMTMATGVKKKKIRKMDQGLRPADGGVVDESQ